MPPTHFDSFLIHSYNADTFNYQQSSSLPPPFSSLAFAGLFSFKIP